MSTVAVVLNFNDAPATLDCLASLTGQRELDGIVVVDNGSRAADLRQLTEALGDQPTLTLITLDHNCGFGAGMNAGLSAALERGADAVFLLNNDTLVAPDAVRRLRAALFASPDIGVAAPLISTGADRIWAAGGEVSPATLKAEHRHSGQPVAQAGQGADISFAPGAALLVSAAALRAAGGFVEAYFLYCEDLEFSIRLREAGFRIRFVPEASVWHAVQGGSTERTARSLYYRARNSLWLGRQRLSPLMLPLYATLVLARLASACLRKSGGRPGILLRYLWQLLRGLAAGVRAAPQTPPHRLPG